MKKINRNSALVLILLLAASSLIMVESASAQSIPKPSVPEFTLTYVDKSYDVAPTYGTDQFTGKTVIKQDGYHVNKQSVVFRIKNQPFTSYNDSNGNNICLYYNFKFKGHYGNEWRDYPFGESGGGTYKYSNLYYTSPESPKLAASNSEYTDIVLSLPFLFGIGDKPSFRSQVDFQVQALTGHIDYVGDGYYRFTGQRSEWSSTQTITIGESTPTMEPTTPTQPTPTPTESTSPTQNPTDIPAQPYTQTDVLLGLEWKDIVIALLGGVVAVLVVTVTVLMHYRKQWRGQT